MTDGSNSAGWTIETLRVFLETRIESVQAAAAAAMQASKEAIAKAENASEKRAEGQNEFRAQLNDQQRTLITRTEVDLRDTSNKALIETVRKDLSTVKEDLRKEIADLRESRSEGKGKGLGMDKFWAYLIAAVALIIALFNFFGPHAASK